MSISDAYVTVCCDECGWEDNIELTALAHHGAYDMRYVARQMERSGWTKDGERDICGECSYAKGGE